MALTGRGSQKYWFNGQPFPGADHNNNAGSQKYWFNGQPAQYIYAAGAPPSQTILDYERASMRGCHRGIMVGVG